MISTHNPSLLKDLNPEQLRAVTWPDESALVLAGAGSGKTRVLTTRIAWLIGMNRASAQTIMAVTFTNKAAKEMRVRLSAMINSNVAGMWLGTFHGLCHRFLRLHYKDAGLPQTFQILDSSDQLSLIKRLLKQWNISDTDIPPKRLQHFINQHKESGRRASMVTESYPIGRKMLECFRLYDEICLREGVLDFAELMLKSYEILAANPLLRQHYQDRFKHILVDEFQDTNTLQYEWIKQLAGTESCVFAVGDDDQSIYRFRGAKVGNMTKLMEDFHIQNVIKLEENYRSAGHILTAANALISHNQDRLGKTLRTQSDDGEKIRFIWANSDKEEAQFVLDEVRSIHREGVDLDDMAVLYRSNAQSRILEQILFNAGIPYQIYGGLRFYERQEIKHAMAYLRLLVNPHDDNAFLRIINTPPRGIGAKSIEKIQEEALINQSSLWTAASSLATQSAKLMGFIRLITSLQNNITSSPLPHILSSIIETSGLLDYYKQQKTDQQDRIDNLEELISAAVAFNPKDSPFEITQDEADPLFPLLTFLANASLESGEGQAKNNEVALQLMTVHAAKGLEFNTVFMTGLEEGLFPSELSLQEENGLEEERRLMYVAITRAEQRLYISAAQSRLLHGQMRYHIVSRFVDEIPEEVLQALSHRATHPRTQTNPTITTRKEPMRETQNYDGFSLGENVRHPTFGLGVIIEAMSKNNGAKLTINFGQEGIKELDTRYAKLEKLN